jgi:protein-S-isoprenylcysteine O-methyltransferase Ste14
MQTLGARAFRSSLVGIVILAALLFVPAGTLDYWQAWVFMAVFVCSSSAVTVYLAIHDPELLERRMRAGPGPEREGAQKIIIILVMTGFLAMLVVPALDRRFGWSHVPAYVCLVGAALVALSFFLIFFVLRANTYAASTVQVAEGQKVISTGPYALVRHPMYAGCFPMLVGIPLALGSWWGLAGLLVFVPTLIWRLVDEEGFLRKNLPGYTEYADKVRYRLVPHVW